MAPEAPAPTQIQTIAVNARKGWIDPGARYKPQIEVNTARAITLGFNNAT